MPKKPGSPGEEKEALAYRWAHTAGVNRGQRDAPNGNRVACAETPPRSKPCKHRGAVNHWDH
jgi:hypothetical protein